ncbi:MAG: hypothetical protein ACKO6Q_09180 [Bacteroidota bacterium]
MLRSAPLAIFLLLFNMGHTQNISGFWRGKLVMGSGGCFPVYQIELQLSVSGEQIRGKAYHFSDSSNFISDEIVGTWDSLSKMALIRETGIVTFRIKEECVPCLKNYELTFHTGSGNRVNELQLRGSWSTPSGRAIDGRTPCSPGTIVLTRFERSSFPEAKVIKSSPPKKIDQLVQEIRLDSSEVQLALYDNGQIDGDTVSVFVNKKPVIQQQMLKTQPITLRVKIDAAHPIQDIVMVGENLGLIPPNTALMIVTTETTRHQLYLTADEQKNALVRLIFDPGTPKKN